MRCRPDSDLSWAARDVEELVWEGISVLHDPLSGRSRESGPSERWTELYALDAPDPRCAALTLHDSGSPTLRRIRPRVHSSLIPSIARSRSRPYYRHHITTIQLPPVRTTSPPPRMIPSTTYDQTNSTPVTMPLFALDDETETLDARGFGCVEPLPSCATLLHLDARRVS